MEYNVTPFVICVVFPKMQVQPCNVDRVRNSFIYLLPVKNRKVFCDCSRENLSISHYFRVRKGTKGLVEVWVTDPHPSVITWVISAPIGCFLPLDILVFISTANTIEYMNSALLGRANKSVYD